MIRPRPTLYFQATRDYYLPRSIDLYDRPVAWCPCGARLSRYRPMGSTLCAPCEMEAIRKQTVEELHPADYSSLPEATSKHHPTRTCSCGRPMYRQSMTCRVCYYEQRRHVR